MSTGFASEAELLAWVTDLARQHAAARRATSDTRDALHAAVRTAGNLTINGQPCNRSRIIEASGLSRRTAYGLFTELG